MNVDRSLLGSCLVTGGAGFIGSTLVKQLVSFGLKVRVLDDFSTGHHANLASVLPDIEIIEGDIRSERLMDLAVNGIDTVFHMAAIASVPLSVSNPKLTFDVNVSGMLNLLVAARDAGCRRVVFSSSCAVYGNALQMPISEDTIPAPMSPYATSKLNGEQLCSVFSTTYGLETTCLRYFNVFGPGQDPDSPYAAVIPKLLKSLQAGVPCVIYGDGTQTRDFIFVDDVVEANLAAAVAPKAVGHVFNVASGRQVTINETLILIAGCLDVPAYASYEPPRAGDLKHSLANITAAQDALEFKPRVSMHDGLERLVAAAAGSLV